MKKLAVILSLALLVSETVFAQNTVSFDVLRDKVKNGYSEVTEDLFIEGVLINLFRCGNLEVVSNDTFTSLSTSDENRTSYVQSLDDKGGIGLHFIASKFADIPQFSKVLINLKGDLLCKISVCSSIFTARKVTSVAVVSTLTFTVLSPK